MVEFGGIFKSMAGWAVSGTFWTVGIIFIIFIIFWFYTFMNRRGKLKYNCLEIVRYGNGKTGVNLLKAGVFKKKAWFFGLLDYGNESVMKVADGRVIIGGKTSQLHDILGKKGFYLMRKTDDPRILVPISRLHFDNLQAMLEIAPANFRDVSVDIVKDAVRETTATWEKILPYIAIGVLVVLCIITIVINQQMTNNTIDKVGKMLIEGCRNTINTMPTGESP